MIIEYWKDIPGYEGEYQASNLGRIRSLKYGKYTILKESNHKKGYRRVVLCKDGNRKDYQVHRLVWEVFKGPIPDGMQVNHIDENTSNNNLDNLMVCTPKENNNWGTHNEKMANTKKKHIFQYDVEGNLVNEWCSISETINNGFNPSAVSMCCLGERKTHGGYKWAYAE